MTTRPGRWTREQLAALELGVQPEQNDHQLCRYCGLWFRRLGNHVVGARHGGDLARYREEFELAATLALAAADLRAADAERGRELLERDAKVRAAFAVDEPVSAEREARRRRGLQRLRSTRSRAGVVRSWRQVGAGLQPYNQQRAARRRAELDEAALQHGYADLASAIQAATSSPELGAVLGVSASTAWRWRSRYQVRAGRAQVAARRLAAQQAAVRQALARVPPGTQPADAGGLLICLECAVLREDLGRHLQDVHQLDADAYRSRHALAAGSLLRSERLDREMRERAAALGRASGAGRRDRYRRRYDALAADAGYGGVEQLLAEQGNHDVARILQLSDDVSAARVRRRYLPGSAGAPSREDRTRRLHDERARQAGFSDVLALLREADTRAAMAALGLSHSRVCRLRKQYLAQEQPGPGGGQAS